MAPPPAQMSPAPSGLGLVQAGKRKLERVPGRQQVEASALPLTPPLAPLRHRARAEKPPDRSHPSPASAAAARAAGRHYAFSDRNSAGYVPSASVRRAVPRLPLPAQAQSAPLLLEPLLLVPPPAPPPQEPRLPRGRPGMARVSRQPPAPAQAGHGSARNESEAGWQAPFSTGWKLTDSKKYLNYGN